MCVYPHFWREKNCCRTSSFYLILGTLYSNIDLFSCYSFVDLAINKGTTARLSFHIRCSWPGSHPTYCSENQGQISLCTQRGRKKLLSNLSPFFLLIICLSVWLEFTMCPPAESWALCPGPGVSHTMIAWTWRLRSCSSRVAKVGSGSGNVASKYQMDMCQWFCLTHSLMREAVRH